MQSNCTYIPYADTGYFSPIVSDYISGHSSLQPFYKHAPNIEGIKAAIANRKLYATNRSLLVNVLRQQYQDIPLTPAQEENINQLSNENCFTVCTAHQPNIFTGYLYFIYKIIHAIKLSETLAAEIAGCHFVPVYYMGSEDADLEELGHIFLDGKKYEWKTQQQGAVGRMKVDKALVQLIQEISGQLLVLPNGNNTVALMRKCYKEGNSVAQATFEFVNSLFANYGLLILLPDNREVKNAFAPVIKKELLEQFSHPAVAATVAAFPSQYKIQAAGRQLNLFYLKDDSRERIEKVNGQWAIVNSGQTFSEQEILQELDAFPERFSPNVILRPVLQETILPNIAFIGGGGEIAYWLELKKVFEAVGVPYPVLVVRNSFVLMDEKMEAIYSKLGLADEELFLPEGELMKRLVKKQSSHQLQLEKEKQSLKNLYQQIGTIAAAVDNTLQPHIMALQKKALAKMDALEKKMLKAEKKKFEAQQRQLHILKTQLFPHNNLQERVENFMRWYAADAALFLEEIKKHSLGLQQAFGILRKK